MLEKRNDGKWFAPKLFGLGAGVPVAWQGWAVYGGFAAAVAAIGLWIERDPRPAVDAAGLAIILSLTAILFVVAHRRTRGGWKWRWGKWD
jgi:hypothetical protein